MKSRLSVYPVFSLVESCGPSGLGPEGRRFESFHPDLTGLKAVRTKIRTAFSLPGLDLRRSEFSSNKSNRGFRVFAKCLNRATKLRCFGSNRIAEVPVLNPPSRYCLVSQLPLRPSKRRSLSRLLSSHGSFRIYMTHQANHGNSRHQDH